MTTPNDVRQQIRLILAQSDVRRLYRTRGTPPTQVDPLHLHQTGFHDHPLFDFDNEQVDVLKRLYVSLPSDAQKSVVNAIIAELNAKNGRIVAHAVVELRDVAALRYWERIDEASAELRGGIAEKLKVEHGKFSDGDLAQLEAAVPRLRANAAAKAQERHQSEAARHGRRIRNVADQIENFITRARYVRLRQQLVTVDNPAIDTDRRELASRLESLGFSKRLATALDEIGRRSAAATTDFDFKSAMDLLRTFYEEFVEEAARLIAPKAKMEVPSGDNIRHFASFKDYLVRAGVLGREEEKFAQALYNYVSNVGSHALGSAPEQFHVTKATVVEWCMMIAGLVERYPAAG